MQHYLLGEVEGTNVKKRFKDEKEQENKGIFGKERRDERITLQE
jgi:hypothetical protein